MIKVLKYLISITLLSIIVAIIILSTKGIETNKFNQLISEKVSNKKNINIKLKTIKFKLDPKTFNLFLDTSGAKKYAFNGLVTGVGAASTVGELTTQTVNFQVSGDVTFAI